LRLEFYWATPKMIRQNWAVLKVKLVCYYNDITLGNYASKDKLLKKEIIFLKSAFDNFQDYFLKKNLNIFKILILSENSSTLRYS